MSAKTGQKNRAALKPPFAAYCLETYTPGAAFAVKLVTVLALEPAKQQAAVRDNTGLKFWAKYEQLATDTERLAGLIAYRFPLSTDATHGSAPEPLSQKMAGAAASA